jgi:hypothetical protein
MKTRYLRFGLLLFCAFSITSKAATLLTATCSPLSGAKVVLDNGKVNITNQTQAGPIFLVTTEKPTKLISIWKFKRLDKETTETYEAKILDMTPEKIQAVELDSQGLYSYTLFLSTGLLLYSQQRLVSPLHELVPALDSNPNVLSFVGTCTIKNGN